MTASHSPALHPAIDAPILRWRHGGAGSQDYTLRYYRSEAAVGRPLVLLHSINAAPSAMEIRPLFNHYRSARPVFAPDLPGFGLSQRGRLPYSPAFFAGAIADFLREVVGEPADLVALSLSAEFAARAWALAPAQVHSLTLISPTGLGRRRPPGPGTVRHLQRLFRLPGLSDGLFRLLTSRPSIRYFLRQSFAGEVPEPLVDYAWHSAREPAARHAPFAFLSMGLFTADALATLYRPLETPTLVLYDRDPNVSFERLPELLAANLYCRARRLAPSRGLPHWEQAGRCVAALDDFWAGVEAGRMTAEAPHG